jgi:hypothetical protein
MANNQAFTQELISAKYFTEPPVEAEAETSAPQRTQRRRSSAERAFSWLNKLVVVSLLAAAGAWLWLNQASLTNSASHFRQRTSSPIDFILWLSGSKHTFKESLAEATSKPIPGLENMKPTYDLGHLNFTNLTNSPAFQPATNFAPSPNSSTSAHAKH